MLLIFALRHLVRHWRMNLVVLIGILLGAALLSSLTMYAAVIAGQNLTQSLGEAYALQRNLEMRAEELDAKVEAQTRHTLGTLFQERIEIMNIETDAQHTVSRPNGEQVKHEEFLYLRFWSFSNLADSVQVLDGRLPQLAPGQQAGEPPVLEAAIGTDAAAYMQLAVGDELACEDDRCRVQIVGIVKPVDSTADIWWSDVSLLPFNVERIPGIAQDSIYISLFSPPESLTALGAPDIYWRVLLDWRTITIDNALPVRNRILQLVSLLAADQVKVETGLVDLIDQYQAQLDLAKVSLLLLSVQSLLAVLYTLGMISTFVLDQSRTELGSLVGRGFSSGQITYIFAVEMFVLAFVIAFPLAPLFALWGFQAWARVVGSVSLQRIPSDSWWLSLAAVAFSWLTLVVPLYLATRRGVFEYRRREEQPGSQAQRRRWVLDIALLALGGLTYWQLLDTGSFVRQAQDAGGAVVDPVLLLGPSLLLLAIGLIFLRLFPLLIRLIAWMARTVRGLVFPFGLTRLARSPGGANRVVLLISLTVGLVFFATVFQDSIDKRQRDIARYLVGADMRIKLPLDAAKAAQDSAHIVRQPGVLAASSVYRAKCRFGMLSENNINLLAVDPVDLVEVVSFPTGIGYRSMTSMMRDLGTTAGATTSDAMPVLLSDDVPPSGVQIGDQIEYYVGTHAYTFEVVGFVEHFPTLEPPFVLTNLPMLERQANLADPQMTSFGGRELWLTIDPQQHGALTQDLNRWVETQIQEMSFQVSRIAGDAQDQLRAFRLDLVSQTTTSAFRLNATTLAILSCISFLLIQAFTARRRLYEFSVLRAIGLSARQLFSMLALEGVITMLLGLLTGTGIGYGLAYVMRPFLSLTLASSLGGRTIDQVIIDWPAIVRLYATLAGFYIVALLLLLFGLLRSDLHRTLRTSEE